MVIDEHREQHGVEPICRTLQVAPSTYYAVKAVNESPSQRALRDQRLLGEIRRVHKENLGVYGARKVWWQLAREDVEVARCTVERLMAKDGLKGAVRGKKLRTTIPDGQSTRAPDLVDRDFKASARTGCGSPISRMCRRGRGRCMSRSRSTCSPGGSWAGRPTRR